MLELADVSRKFGTRWAVRHLDFELRLEPGEPCLPTPPLP